MKDGEAAGGGIRGLSGNRKKYYKKGIQQFKKKRKMVKGLTKEHGVNMTHGHGRQYGGCLREGRG